jgi:hypothetical protein
MTKQWALDAASQAKKRQGSAPVFYIPVKNDGNKLYAVQFRRSDMHLSTQELAKRAEEQMANVDMST